MVAPLSVRKVESKADYNTFLRFPWTLYKDDPYWVPPLPSLQRHKLDQVGNPTWKHMQGDYFVAWRGNTSVGTIAAFINHRHNEYHGEHIGFFGTFELYDDQEVADALLDTASRYVRDLGYDAIRGPASFSTNEECGILIDGFDDPPAILMPYNYPYYQRLLDNSPGFEKVMDLYSYHLTLGKFEASDKLEQALRVTRRNNARRQIEVRKANRKALNADLEMLREVYNAAWEKNWGFVPLSDDELDELIKDLGQFLDTRLAFFATVKGDPAAFMLAFPDMNQPLHVVYPRPGKPEWLTLLQMLWHWKIRSKITRIRIALLGVKEAYRHQGVEAALFAELFNTALTVSPQTGWRSADAGWVLETNQPMSQLVEALSGRVYKRYRFYQRDLTS